MSKINYPVIFTHVPRSGGITLNSILRNNFPASRQFAFYITEHKGSGKKALSDFEALPDKEKKKLQLLTGHMDFGLHRYYDTPCTYLTLFRNPVSRILSYYTYIVKSDIHYLHNTVVRNRMQLKDILEAKISIEFDNAQVRQISGIQGVKCGQCTPAMLEKAKENLDKYYPIFGITEKFNESLVLLKKYFDFPAPYYTSLNKSKSKEPVKASDETVQAIKESNYLDMQFYEYARQKFSRMMENYGEGFEEQVHSFNRKNKTISKFRIGSYDYGVKAWQLYTKASVYRKHRSQGQ